MFFLLFMLLVVIFADALSAAWNKSFSQLKCKFVFSSTVSVVCFSFFVKQGSLIVCQPSLFPSVPLYFSPNSTSVNVLLSILNIQTYIKLFWVLRRGYASHNGNNGKVWILDLIWTLGFTLWVNCFKIAVMIWCEC